MKWESFTKFIACSRECLDVIFKYKINFQDMPVKTLAPRELANINDELNKMFRIDQKAKENSNV